MIRFKPGDKVIITGYDRPCNYCRYSSCKECVNQYDNEDDILTVIFDNGENMVNCRFPKIKGKEAHISSQCSIYRKDLSFWTPKNIKWRDFLKR